jgi:predicted nucleic acid-binding protein
MIYVLDACALVAFLKKEEGVEKVLDILQETENGTTFVYMSIMNLIEVHYGFVCSLGKKRAAEILDQIHDLPIQIVDTINSPVFDEAVRLKSSYSISLADAIGLATAINLKGTFVSSDGELVEPKTKEHAPVFWFRPPKEKS